MINVVVDKDYVAICGQLVNRPVRVSPKQWLDFWDQVKDPELFLKREYDKGYLDGERADKESTWNDAHQDGYNEGHGDGYQEGIRAATTVPHK